MALGRGPLRTNQLAERIQGFSSRTLYRHMGCLAECNLIDRYEEPGVPSTVVYSLTEPSGRNLFRLLCSFTGTPIMGSPRKGRDAKSWASLGLLGEMWELGFVAELSQGPRSPTELARGRHDVSYHQVNRRAGLFMAGGLLTDSPPNGNGRRYELTNHGRRHMALLAGIGRWRHRYVVTKETSGLTVAEVATILRTALPLTLLPAYSGKSITLGITGAADDIGHRNIQTLHGRVDSNGTMQWNEKPDSSADGWAVATINIWFAALLDGKRGRMRVGGDLDLIDTYLKQLYEVLGKKGQGLQR